MTVMHSLYDNARQMFGTQQLSWLACNPRLQLVTADYVATVGDRTLADVPPGSRISLPLLVFNTSMDRGIARAADVTVDSSYAGLFVTAAVLYSLGIDDFNSPLIAFYGIVLGLPAIVPPGGAVLTWDAVNGAFRV